MLSRLFGRRNDPGEKPRADENIDLEDYYQEDEFSSLSDFQKPQSSLPLIGRNSLMKRKQHGTSAVPIQPNLKWKVNRRLANRICNHNRHFAEKHGYFHQSTPFLRHEDPQKSRSNQQPLIFYDSNTGLPLFRIPRSASGGNVQWHNFVHESKRHGWPSFRDQHVNWKHVRCLANGECISRHGTHLGHNIPDAQGKNRYCINLVSIAGYPTNTNNNTCTSNNNSSSSPKEGMQGEYDRQDT